jgi:hypothetical protein
LLKSATAELVELGQAGQPNYVSMFSSTLIQARSFGVVLRQAPAAVLEKGSEMSLASCVPLVRSQPVEPRSLVVVLRQSGTAVLVENAQIVLSGGVSLIGG